MYSSTIKLTTKNFFDIITDSCFIRLQLTVNTIYIVAGADKNPDTIIIEGGLSGDTINVEYDSRHSESTDGSHHDWNVSLNSGIRGTKTFDNDGVIKIKSTDHCGNGNHVGTWIRYKFIYLDQIYYLYEIFI